MADSPQEKNRKFGAEIRRMRLRAGYSQQQLADKIPISQSAVSDIERGRTAAKKDQVQRIDQVLTGKGRLAALWEAQYDGYEIPGWIREVSALEGRASQVRDYHPLVVPGLLQTEDYARAAVRAGNKAAASGEIETVVKGRMERQELLRSESPPRYVAVIDEAVLRRPTGGKRVMAGQIRHLLRMADNEHIEVLLVPMQTPMHPGMDGAFRLITVPDVGEILWREVRKAGGPVEEPAHVEDHLRLFADLLGVALPAAASAEMLKSIEGETE